MVLLFLLSRFLLMASWPPESLRGYGDFYHYYNLVSLGRPFFDLWVEYPPIFPFLAAVLFRLAGGRQHVFDYLLIFILALAQAGSLWIVARLTSRLYGEAEGARRSWTYFALVSGLAYGWWYFDPLAVVTMLAGLYWILEGRVVRSGILLAVGMLIKWFPGLALAAAWRRMPVRLAARLTILSLGIVAVVLAGLYAASPEMTAASVYSQASKGSWETIWALVDGNLGTGNFGPLVEREDPGAALEPVGKPARFSMWVTLPLFALPGLALFWRLRRNGPGLGDSRSTIAFLGLTWCVFLLWLPGYSPQWVLYLIPIILLALPESEAILAAALMTMVNLLEWPLLLSRGLNWSLWLTVPLRAGLLLLLAFRFWASALRGTNDGSD